MTIPFRFFCVFVWVALKQQFWSWHISFGLNMRESVNGETKWNKSQESCRQFNLVHIRALRWLCDSFKCANIYYLCVCVQCSFCRSFDLLECVFSVLMFNGFFLLFFNFILNFNSVKWRKKITTITKKWSRILNDKLFCAIKKKHRTNL